MDIISVIVTAIPELLGDMATVVVRAVPDMGGGLPLAMVGAGVLLLMAWHYDFV